ncbi:MAG TPA: hypothetical protein VGQ97_07295 [Xanthobacteraceae bacterium]|nr:hypothetical protein [Xanthobacteraceae bacterium]
MEEARARGRARRGNRANGAAWQCSISPGGQKVTCNYVGPMPVPMGFGFPPITVRALAKKIMGSFLWAPVCGDVGAYQANVLQPLLAQGCALVVIIP